MLSSTELFKCLSDETRLFSTLLIHHEKELCVCELMSALELSQPKISRHLSQLKNTGVLTSERRGQWVFYSLNTKLPKWALKVIRISHEANTEILEKLLQKLALSEAQAAKC